MITSVLITLYNHEKYIEFALNSLLKSNTKNIQLVVNLVNLVLATPVFQIVRETFLFAAMEQLVVHLGKKLVLATPVLQIVRTAFLFAVLDVAPPMKVVQQEGFAVKRLVIILSHAVKVHMLFAAVLPILHVHYQNVIMEKHCIVIIQYVPNAVKDKLMIAM